MKFSIGLSSEVEAKSKSRFIHELGQKIADFLATKNYGEGIKEYGIMLNLTSMPPGPDSDRLFKEFKPKFTEYKLLTNPHTGLKFEIEKYFDYSLKIDGERYLKILIASDEESRKLIAGEIFNSFSKLDALPKKVKDFDKERFKADMEQFFKEQGLI